MAFWSTFVKVWQVRTSYRIQESIENAYHESRNRADAQRNLPEIISELDKKKDCWENELEIQRKMKGM